MDLVFYRFTVLNPISWSDGLPKTVDLTSDVVLKTVLGLGQSGLGLDLGRS